MADRLDEVVAPRRFSAVTLGVFAAGSLLLAALGLYGLLVFSVGARVREIAVRLALGAEPQAIVRMIVGQGLKLVSVGLIAGFAASLGLTRLLTSLLYQTNHYDVMTFAIVPFVLVIAALLACALPAWRAAKIEPLKSLRAE